MPGRHLHGFKPGGVRGAWTVLRRRRLCTGDRSVHQSAQGLGSACNDSNACTQTDACDGAGVCVGSSPVNCASSVLYVRRHLQPGNGQCEGGTPSITEASCDDGNICTSGDLCVAGTCTGTGCVLPQVCTSTGCALPPANIVKPQVARLVATPGINGLAMDLDGHSYITGAIFTPGKTFDSGVVTSFGGADVLVAKFDPITHLATWAKNYGAGTSEASGSSDQFGYGIAVTADNTVAVIGNFLGGLQAGASVNLVNTGTAPIDFLIGLDGANGNGKWGKSFNEGLSGAIVAVAANPAHNLIAICGYAGQAAIDLVPTATFGGGTDIVIGMFNSNGTLVWSRQMGGAAVEECDSLVIDNNGDLYAAGKYNGGTGFVTDLGLGALPNPGNSFRRWLWVAKFNGTTGATIANASFYGCATSGQPCMNGVHTPNALALDSQNKLLVTGNFTNVLSFDPTAVTPHAMTSAGGADAFVAKLDPAAGFARVWSVSMGSLIDDSAQGVSVTSTGDVVAVGYYQGDTAGGATLTNAGAADAFVWKLSGLDGTTQQAVGYGDALGQSADKIAINGQGTSNIDLVEIAGLLNGTITFPAPAGALTATETSSFLVFATLAP